jgi:hypothetical protein
VLRLTELVRPGSSDPEAEGFFCGETTFERDLFDASASNATQMLEALSSLLAPTPALRLAERIEAGDMDSELFLRHIEGAKGRYAQRLAARSPLLRAPAYVERALRHVLA